MDASVVWLIVGIGLVIVEVLTGTLYLLFLGLAALAASLAAYLGYNFATQVGAFAIVAAVSLWWVQTHRRTRDQTPMQAMEVGQPVAFESWVDAPQRLARVRFRGTLWDALVDGECRGEAGEVLYIRAVNGSQLTIARTAA